MALCVDKLLPKKNKGIVEQAIGIIVTFVFITFTWIFFRADSFSTAWIVIKGIFTLQNGIRQPFSWSIIAIAILIICTVITVIKGHTNNMSKINGYYPTVNLNCVIDLTIFFVIVGLILGLAYTGENPFVYFQF